GWINGNSGGGARAGSCASRTARFRAVRWSRSKRAPSTRSACASWCSRECVIPRGRRMKKRPHAAPRGASPMASAAPSPLIRHLRRAALARADRDLTDSQLLECFLTRRDEAAFAALVRRHGPMVLGVCRRVLRNHHDAEDAFQAAFLVLARKAAAIGRRELLGPWLYGVAYRTALKARGLR